VDVTVLSGDVGRGTPATPTVFDSPEISADRTVLRALSNALVGADLAAPAVVLPDFHHKSDMEMPSSIAVATLDTIRPVMTSASVNCGMALIALDTDQPSDRAITTFFDSVRRRYPHPPGWNRDLSSADVLRAAVEGAAFGVDRYGLDDGALERIENGGRIDLERWGGPVRVRRELPWLSMQMARMRFGTVGPSNHFVELQVVDEVLDAAASAHLGVKEGQLTIQYHAGGGQLTGQVGRLFGRRMKMSKPLRIEIAVTKPLFHFASARSWRQVRERKALYYSAAMNYGFAFRAATYASLCALARQQLSIRGARLIVDSPHNSIYEEEVGGETAVVHRHNACRAYPAHRMPAGSAFAQTGQALLLPGTHRTSSYLCVAQDGAARSLYSACHGAGTTIEDFVRRGISGPRPSGTTTLRFRYSGAAPEHVPHLDDRGVDGALGILAGHGILRPVARLRPLAVLT